MNNNARTHLTTIICLLFVVFIAFNAPSIRVAFAQDKGGPVPLNPNDPSPPLTSALNGQEPAQPKINIGYLGEVPRGERITILFMSGARVTGNLVGVRSGDMQEVLMLDLAKHGKKMKVGYYKITTVAGIEWTR